MFEAINHERTVISACAQTVCSTIGAFTSGTLSVVTLFSSLASCPCKVQATLQAVRACTPPQHTSVVCAGFPAAGVVPMKLQARCPPILPHLCTATPHPRLAACKAHKTVPSRSRRLLPSGLRSMRSMRCPHRHRHCPYTARTIIVQVGCANKLCSFQSGPDMRGLQPLYPFSAYQGAIPCAAKLIPPPNPRTALPFAALRHHRYCLPVFHRASFE